ncbi:MAG: hypothetical protein IJP77_01555 [Bacteroidales bacterium]|nr:hypothetical protein [Bacteroidales bacterium]
MKKTLFLVFTWSLIFGAVSCVDLSVGDVDNKTLLKGIDDYKSRFSTGENQFSQLSLCHEWTLSSSRARLLSYDGTYVEEDLETGIQTIHFKKGGDLIINKESKGKWLYMYNCLAFGIFNNQGNLSDCRVTIVKTVSKKTMTLYQRMDRSGTFVEYEFVR